jgi:hypothetical protein
MRTELTGGLICRCAVNPKIREELLVRKRNARL